MIFTVRQLIIFAIFGYFLSFKECKGAVLYNNDPIPADSNCANIFESRSYQGRRMDFSDNDKLWNLNTHNFRLQSAKVRDGCSLSVFGEQEHKKLLTKNEEWIWGWNHKIAKACCECNGCDGQAAKKDLHLFCAKLFQHGDCNGCFGFRLFIRDGDRVRSFKILNNMMKSLVVRPGCTLTVFDDPNFEGHRYKFTGPHNNLGRNWHEQISSAICNCDAGTPPQTTTPLPRPTTTSTTTQRTTTTAGGITWKPTEITEEPITETTTEKCLDSFDCEEPVYDSNEGGIEIGPAVTTTVRTTTLPPLPDLGSDEGWVDSSEEEVEITLPTVPTTTEATSLGSDEGGGWGDSEEESTTTARTITLPTVPTTPEASDEDDDWGDSEEESTTTARTITLPTVPTTPEASDEDDNWGDSEEESTTTARTITLPTVPTTPEASDEDDNWGDSEEESTTTARTITKPTPSTTTEASDEDDDWGDSEEQTTTTARPITKPTPPATPEGSDEDDDWPDYEEEVTTTTARTTTTTKETILESDEDDGWDDSDEVTTTRKTTTTTESTNEEEYKGSDEDEDDDDEDDDEDDDGWF